MRSFAIILLSTLPAGAGVPAQASAQTAHLPDPATVKTPDITPSHDPSVRSEGYKFYYFHRASVGFGQANQDLKECQVYLVPSALPLMPAFIPWDEAYRKRIPEATPMYGLVGAGILAIIGPKFNRGIVSTKMRRCMGTRGYDRFAIPKGTWETLDKGNEEEVKLMQAKVASGPRPNDEAVVE